MTIVKTNTQSW